MNTAAKPNFAYASMSLNTYINISNDTQILNKIAYCARSNNTINSTGPRMVRNVVYCMMRHPAHSDELPHTMLHGLHTFVES